MTVSAQEPSLPPKRLSPPSVRLMAMWAFVLAVVVAWQVYSSFVPPVVIPSPQRVLLRFGQLWTEPRYLL